MTWVNIKKFVICVLTVFAVLNTSCGVFAIEEVGKKLPTVVVLSDSNHRHGTTYLICGAASDIIASDIVNKLNQSGKVKAPLLGDSMSQVTKNIPLYTNTFFREYKYNYNVDFVNLKRVTRNMQADYILMVTSGIDIQSQLFKENWWNKWGISSSQPITPTYILATMITLIDKRTYNVVWQDMYQRAIKAENMDLGITQFSPNYPQLSKIKKYSSTMSEYVVDNIEKVIVPVKQSDNDSSVIEMKSRFLNEGTKIYYPTVNGEIVKQNFDEAKQNIGEFATEQKIKWQKNREQKQKKKLLNINTTSKDTKTPATKQDEERLFDSIRNNVEDVTNSLPEPKNESRLLPLKNENLQPAVDVKRQSSPSIEENIKPVTNEIPKQESSDDVKPTVLQQQPKTEYVTPIEHVKPEPNVDYQTPKNHVPRYDWNLKNIYLQKIGLSNLY